VSEQTCADLTAGLSAQTDHVVTEADSAARWGNELEVLATPVLLWLGEITAMKAVGGAVPDTEMTVGFAHDVRHLAPTPIGDIVRITATLVEVDGRKLVFEVSAADSSATVLAGRHTRAIVNRAAFTARVRG
jgi:fluoroacetyl-CoA thioesterase